MAEAKIPGGYYMGANGVLHDAWGNSIPAPEKTDPLPLKAPEPGEEVILAVDKGPAEVAEVQAENLSLQTEPVKKVLSSARRSK